MKRCHICERPLDHDHDPHAPVGHYADERRQVAMRNGLYVDACWSCWFKWPDERKIWPTFGFGRAPVNVDRVVAVLQETA